MQIDTLDDIRSARAMSGLLYQEFLRRPSMSAGLYELTAGAVDPQQPHNEDELYYVIAGAARFECAGVQREVGPGDAIFVEAFAPHRFVDITADLSVLVVFAPAEIA
jgi:mannose-6-phosphate isomerase-like protein (cupin superfamily)